MSNWIEHTPSKTGEVGPGYEPGMECEYRRVGGWGLAKPLWLTAYAYRYRWAKPVEEVPDWALRELCKRAMIDWDTYQFWLTHRANVARAIEVGARLIAAHEPKPQDPFERAAREMFDRADAPQTIENIEAAAEALREMLPALIAAKGDE